MSEYRKYVIIKALVVGGVGFLVARMMWPHIVAFVALAVGILSVGGAVWLYGWRQTI